ncbi:MAG: glycyl radical enzyme domain-containing protein [Thermoanaerobaculia bacterium]
MSSIDRVVASTQPGLMLMPTHGVFVIASLKHPEESQPVLVALRRLAAVDDENRRIVVTVDGSLWSRWTGTTPPGAPPPEPLLARDAHFRDSGGDLFLYLKGDSWAAVDELAALVDEHLGDLLAGRAVTRAALPPDGKILDQHFTDGFTSASDPASVVERVLQTGTDSAPGSCWAIAQKFEVMWTAFSDMNVDAQQNTIGRDDAGVLIPDQDVRSHIKRVRALAEDHANYELVRQALPFGPMPNSGGRERGIYFAAFAQSTDIFERLLSRMIGGDSGDSDKLLGIVRGVEGGYFYVPSAKELGLKKGLRDDDFRVAEFWDVRSANGLMFYNSFDYLNTMGTGNYAPGDPPSQRILSLLGKVFGRWQDKWYRELDTPRMQPLSAYLDPDEEHYRTAPVAVRQGLSVKKMLGRVCTNTEYPVPRDSWAWQADVFRIDPHDLLAGVMPELSLGRGKEVMPYLNADERLQGWLAAQLDETSGMGHVVPKHAKVLSMGFGAMLDDLRTRERGASGDQQTFYQSAILALEGVQEYCRNYALLAERMAADHATHPEAQANFTAIAARMRKLATEKPDDFVEAAQLIFTYHCCLHLTGLPVSVGRLDQLLWPYFKTVSEEQAQEVLDAFWVKLGEKALHNRQHATDHVTYGTTSVSYVGGPFPQGDGINQWVQQVTIGGYKANDAKKPEGAANRLTLLCLRSARRLPLNAPVLSLRVYPGIGKDIIEEAARALASGGSHPILFQEDRMVRALSEFSGLPLDAARNYVCDGCYEPMVEGQCEFMFSNVTLLDPLELALNQGARFTAAGPVYLRGSKVSFRSPVAAEITSFAQLQELYLEHLRWLTVQFFQGVLGNYGSLWNTCPCPLLSVAVDGCVETGRDLTNGGTRFHLIAPMFLAASTAIDSLYAVKKLVFDEETAVTTLPELVVALQNDWGYGMTEPFQSVLAGPMRSDERAARFKQIRAAALALPRFGMGNGEVDAIGEWLVSNMTTMAKSIVDHPPEPLKTTLDNVRKNYSTPEQPWDLTLQVGCGTFEAYVGDALGSGASPDGRRNAQPFPSDFSPTPVPQDLPPIAQDPRAKGAVPGTNRPIYTAMSSWNVDAINHRVSNAAPVDLNVREDFPVEKIEELIREYAAGNVGSNLITVTVADPDTYAAAAVQPEKYELVRVRMGGWTEFFSAMFPAHHEQHRRRPYFVPEERG